LGSNGSSTPSMSCTPSDERWSMVQASHWARGQVHYQEDQVHRGCMTGWPEWRRSVALVLRLSAGLCQSLRLSARS
jgi:hypothetical protein